MSALLRAELVKLRTTWTPWGLLLALLAIVAIAVVAQLAVRDAFELEGDLDGIFAAPGVGIVFVLVIGQLVLAGEYRHGTITSTYLVTPARERVLAAKLVTGAAVGLAFGVLAELLAAAIALPWLAALGVELPAGEIAGIATRTLLATVLCGALGVAIGSVVRNQVVGLVLVFMWFLMVEPLLGALLARANDEVGKFTPGQAIAGVFSSGDDSVLPVWGAALVLLGYVALLSAAGAKLVLPRDVNSIQA